MQYLVRVHRTTRTPYITHIVIVVASRERRNDTCTKHTHVNYTPTHLTSFKEDIKKHTAATLSPCLP